MRWIVLLFVAMPLFAQTQLCRFRADDPQNPFRRWLASADVVCAAESEALPAGSWNVFAKTSDAISLPVYVTDRTVLTPSMRPLLPAARLTAQLPQGQRGVVYAPRRSVAWPAQERMLVPAGEPLWLIALERSNEVAAIVSVAPLDPRSERTIVAQTSARTPLLLAWLHVDPDEREEVRDATVAPPIVRYATLDADPLPPLDALSGAFVVVRGVTAGDAELDIGGKGWLPFRTRAKVAERIVTVVENPLLVRPASSIIVSFSTQDDLVELERSIGSCDERHPSVPTFEIALSRCAHPRLPNEAIDEKTCIPVRNESFDAQVPYGSFTADDVPPGMYRAVLTFGRLKPLVSVADVPPFEQRPLRISGHYDALYGSLTRGGEKLAYDATVAFPGGTGFASQETGEYRAVLLDQVEMDQKIDIRSCEGGIDAMVFAETDSRPDTRFDLDIPENRLIVEVTDTFTQMALTRATLKYSVMSKRSRAQPIYTQTFTPNGEENHRFVIKGVPERMIELVVTHPGYQQYRVPPFTMEKSGERTIDAQLVPLRGSRGRIVSAKPFDEAMVLWMSPSGTIVETADVAADGSFIYTNRHEAGETIAIASRSHPLWVARMPQLQVRQELEVPFPDAAPVRTLAVTVRKKPRPSAHIGFVIGGVLVPQSALRAHQSFRNEGSMVHGGATRVFRDFVESGPIEVILGPTVQEVPTVGRSVDPLLLPQAIDAPRQRAPAGVTEIVFE